MKVAIVGASVNKTKYSNKAVRAYKAADHTVFPVNPNEREIEGLKCYTTVLEIPLDLDLVSVYLPPVIGLKVMVDIVKKGTKRVILNPGSESKEIIRMLKMNKIDFTMTCSIKEIGADPAKL
ncbi:MAG: CoA-binding protein [archaeon]